MPTEFRPSTPEDLPAIAGLMQSAFDAPANAPFLNTDLMRWKYFERNPEWPDTPRSYVLDQDGKLFSHGCLWPVRPGMACLIDWASAKTVPGMGLMLARKMAQLQPVLLSIGGSAMTQQIMPKIGFEKKGELVTYARVLRPWQQFFARPDKSPLRLFRNVLWSLEPKDSSRGWTAVEIRGPEYLMHCPGAKMKCYQLPSGTLLLSQVGGQARIAAIASQSESAYAAAIEAARRDPRACELIAVAYHGAARRALIANGFVERMRRSVFVHDPGHTVAPSEFPLPLDMLADDLFYLNTPQYPFLT